jgi:hypothetical protein
MTVVSDISINPKTINVSDIGKLEVQNRKPFQKEPSTCDADTTVDSFIVVENFEDPRQQDDLRKSLETTESHQRRIEKAPTGASAGTSNLSQPKLAASRGTRLLLVHDELSFFSLPTPEERFQELAFSGPFLARLCLFQSNRPRRPCLCCARQ